MEVRIKKIHNAWNGFHRNEFNVGDTVELVNNKVTTKSGKTFDGRDLTRCFSNKSSYSDIFEKLT